MWVRFTADHDYYPSAHGGRVCLAYKAGTVDNVTRECADQALAAGKAEKTTSPRNPETENGEENSRG